MATLNDEAESEARSGHDIRSDDEDNDKESVVESEADQHSDAGDESGSQAGSETSSRDSPPSPPQPNILMIVLAGLSTEPPALHTSSTMEVSAHVAEFSYDPVRFLGERGSLKALDDIIKELLEYVITAAKEEKLNLFDPTLGLGFMAADLGGTLVKQALLYAMTDPKYRFIYMKASVLIFFGTPHQPSGVFTWETIILMIIEDSYRGLLGYWLPDRIQKLSVYLELVREDWKKVSDRFRIVNYVQDLPKSSPEVLTVHKSCASSQGFNVTNITVVGVTHYELPCFVNESEPEDYIVRRVSDTLIYANPDFRQLVRWLSLEADRIEINFSVLGRVNNLADCIAQSEELSAFIHNDQAQLISLEMEVELDGKAILSCLQFAIHKALKPYPEVVIACSSLTTTEPSSLTETGLLSSCLVQILNQHPSSSSWLGAFSNRLSSTLRIPNVELRVRTLWQCLRLVFTHTSDCRGLWLIHTTGSPEQRQLLLKVAKRLRYFEELDQIGWKVIIISNSASKIDFPPSKALSRVTLSLDVLRDSIEKDVQSQLDDAIRATPSLMNAKDTALQLLRKHDFNHKFFEFFGDSLWLTSPPIPDVLANLADAFSSVETGLHTIFERVPTQYRTWARKVLEVVCFSFRPMTTSELAIAVAAIDCQSFDQLQRNIDLGTADHIQRLLPGILLVHIGKIYVLHEELELFLRQSESDAWYHIGDCHMKMAKSHFNYLSLILETFGNVETLMVKVIIRDRRQARDAPGSLEDGFFENQALELAPYAALYWYDHYVLARNAEKASSEPPTWSPEPPFLKEMLALRSYGKWRPDRDIDLYWELSQLHLEQAPNMSQFEAFEMAVEVIERRPGDAYIDLMYFPTPSASDVPIRDWVRSNLPLLSIPEIIASHPRVLDVLLEHDRVMMLDCLPDILVSIVSRNDPAFLVDFLRKLDGQVDIREASRRALAFAVVWDMVDIARLLLSYRIIPPEAFRMEPNEVALLHTAVTTGDVEMVQLVLSVGAEPNVLSQGALLGIAATPLHIACRLGLERIVRLLLDAGADVNFSDVNNKITALHVASSRGFPSICKLLIDHGAIISLDSDGQTPLHLPARYSRIPRYKRTATLLLEALKKQFPRFREGGSEGDSEDAKALKAVINAQYGRKKKTALIYAAVAGDVELATSLIDLGADLYSIEDEEHTAAARAAMMNDADMVRCLLDSGTDVDWTSSDGRSILHDACVWGSTSVIELLLERGALIDRLDTDNVPPIAVAATWNLLRTVRQMASRCSKVSTSLALILAARYGYYRVAVELLAAGADINHQDEFGNTPLQFSCWNSSPRVTELFLTRMVDINRSDKDNITALADAARRGGMECLKLLLDAGADTEIASLSGKTALIRAADFDAECFRLLLERGAEPSLPESISKPGASIFKAGMSFLGALAHDFPVAAVEVYLGHLRPQASDELFLAEITEALSTAAYSSKLDTLQVLLKAGADPNSIVSKFDESHGSPMGIAIMWDNIDAVKILLENKITPVNINKVDDYRDTPLHIALHWCRADVKKEMLELLLEHGANPTISSGNFGTVLNATCETVDEDIVQLILSQPGVSRDIADDLGRLPLHLAAACTSAAVMVARVEFLTTETSTVKSRDKQGRNALHYAAASGSLELIEKILKVHPDLINVADRDGWTPLHWACRQDNVTVVDTLIDRGANKEAKTHDKWTPRHVAIYHAISAHLEHLPDDGTESDDDELPSEAAEMVTESQCHSCFCGIFGTGYRCSTCPLYWFCFKCYWSAEDTHPKEHVFQRSDQEMHEMETPPVSDPDVEE